MGRRHFTPGPPRAGLLRTPVIMPWSPLGLRGGCDGILEESCEMHSFISAIHKYSIPIDFKFNKPPFGLGLGLCEIKFLSTVGKVF